jgi:predicted metal-dependent phosphoesterase TrpH
MAVKMKGVMSLRIDLHVHTQLHSPCSRIDPEQLVHQAVRAGLHGLVVTEHQYQWSEQDLAVLMNRSGELGFVLLTGIEYWSGQGDLLFYGLSQDQAMGLQKGLPPEEAVRLVHEMGGTCIAAHPTRAGMGFDERIATLSLDAIEVRSVNLLEHEQRLALHLAGNLGLPCVAGSDAHQLHDVGLYATEFEDPIQSMGDLQVALRRGRFRMEDAFKARTGMI